MVARAVEEIFRREGGKVLAGLIRRFGDIGLAEDLLQAACIKAMEAWRADGLPDNPAAWLTTVARNHGLDIVRRDARIAADSSDIIDRIAQGESGIVGSGDASHDQDMVDAEGDEAISDDRLRLIFVCCHPALNGKAQAMLALRTLCGLSTREIARAYLESEDAAAQRMVRAKRKIKDAGIPFEVPGPEQLGERIDLVLQVVYLMYNEGYGAAFGPSLLRADLCAEAIRLARLLCELMPGQAEAMGLLALMILQHARRDARVSGEGALVTLEYQDRSQWYAHEIDEGRRVLDAAMALRTPGPYQIQAAIAALHSGAPDAQSTDWGQIAQLYGALLTYWPTPVVDLNAAIAVGMADGFDEGLRRIESIEARGDMADSHYLHAAKADLLRRLGRFGEAATAFDRALELVKNDVERLYLLQQRQSLSEFNKPPA